MQFVFDERPSDSSLVDMIWQTRSVGSGSFISPAAGRLELVVTRQRDSLTISVRGPETHASSAPIPEDADFLGILFRLGTYMPDLPVDQLVDGGIHLPAAAGESFWLGGSAWAFPDFDNADTFVDRLVRRGLLAHEPLVPAALRGEWRDLSARSVQRRFRRVTGLTHGTLAQIERARHAASLLQQGVSILDTVELAGYYDQPHLTRALKHFIGQTPAQLSDHRKDE